MEKSKVVIVTGGSRGIGACFVERLARDGYQVILNYYHSEKEAKEIQEKLKAENKNIDIVKTDVSKKEEAKALVEFAIQKYQKIDVLINNAGIDKISLFTDVTEEDWNTILATNLSSAFFMSQEASRYIISQKEGSIINISSIWGITGASCEVAYSVSKAGMNGLTKALAKELGPSNIRVNAIAPGIIQTSMNDGLTKEEIGAILDEIPLHRIGKTEDLYPCLKWLIEDNYTTGQIISVNGGWNI